MKRFITEIIVSTSLLLASSCSSVTPSNETRVSSSDTNHTEHHEHTAEQSQALVITPKKLVVNQPIDLVINIQDSTGKTIDKFDTFQEKLMHLIIVREDLATFDHIHPDYQGNGSFKINPNFSSSGNYYLFSDYQPAGQKETVSLMQVKIPGAIPLPKNLEKFEKNKVISNVKVNFNLPDKNIRAGQEVSLKFAIQDAENNQSIKDLKPYLGERGHLVIIKSSSPLTIADYIHAHAIKNSPDGQIEFLTHFPQPGTYKLWMQFNRNGKINTADFWVNVG
ncbi:hypothetical protein [Nostoc sp. FACHB-110]|uniref:hypothetical protein n=1 Tax=Nostoc sp. FACHB-110 TaxID=2692834 RepID=UPI00168410B6|nr:hypothetical protein [Nostoc sp. FACHB-110]MBD2438880.1 hypothetical protein [Nostoc sp. FACHB-110]